MSLQNTSVFQERLDSIRQQFDSWGVNGVLISSPTNRRWLSGFTGSSGQMLITQNKAILATDFRYWEQATIQAPNFVLFKQTRKKEDSINLFALAGVDKIGLEAQYVTLAESTTLNKLDGIEWVSLAETAESLRKIKDSDEIQAIRDAAAITDKAMAQVNKLVRPGMSEQAVAWELEKTMRELGADGMAFEVIVASGPNASLPHHSPGNRRLEAGDPIIIDMGARLNGYHSDMTRSFHLGNQPDEQFWRVYNLVLESLTAVLARIKPGMNGKEVDALARDIIKEGGYGEYFGHGLGHGVGLEIHEGPRLSSRSESDTMAANMVITVEPGIYLSGWGGIRIEDLILVTDSGYEYLSQCPKKPIIPTD